MSHVSTKLVRNQIRESDEVAIERAFAFSERIPAEHGQPVMVIEVDGETVYVELLERRNVGRRGWLKLQIFTPDPMCVDRIHTPCRFPGLDMVDGRLSFAVLQICATALKGGYPGRIL